jgi:spoIIIJ-associated protein
VSDEQTPANDDPSGDPTARRAGTRRRGGRGRTRAAAAATVAEPGEAAAAPVARRPRSNAPTVSDPDQIGPAKDLLVEILTRMGITGVDVVYISRPEGEYLEVRGSDLANLIGRHGNTLEALNLIFNNIINVGVRNNRKYYSIDAEGYRARRAEQLKMLALQTLERVVRERKPIALQPMLPSERKIVHLALADSPFVSTESQGVEPERRLIVSPK